MNLDQLKKEAFSLPISEQIHLLSDLFEKLISSEQKERELKWALKSEERIKEYKLKKSGSEDWLELRKRLES